MAKGLRDVATNPDAAGLGHAAWLALIDEQEVTLRRQKRFETRARTARLRHPASVEDVDYPRSRPRPFPQT